MEGEVTSQAPWEHLPAAQVEQAVRDWVEQKVQVIPPFSAAKHQGQPLYKLAREGKETPLKTKPLHIFRSEVLSMDLPDVRFRVECGSGAYIRSLVHSLGTRLGCGAVLTELVREQSRPFGLDQAHALDAVLADPESFPDRVIPLEQALPHWPRVTVNAALADKIRNGAPLPMEPGLAVDKTFETGRKALFLAPDGSPLSLMETRLAGGKPVWAVVRGLWG